jgi:hypothetical protein
MRTIMEKTSGGRAQIVDEQDHEVHCNAKKEGFLKDAVKLGTSR